LFFVYTRQQLIVNSFGSTYTMHIASYCAFSVTLLFSIMLFSSQKYCGMSWARLPNIIHARFW